MAWLLGALQSLLNWLGGLLGQIVSWVLSLFWSVWDRAVDLIGQLMTYMLGFIPAGLRTQLNTIPWASMRTYMDQVNWFIPIYGILAIVLSTIGLGASVRVGRWIKSFIPTVGD